MRALPLVVAAALLGVVALVFLVWNSPAGHSAGPALAVSPASSTPDAEALHGLEQRLRDLEEKIDGLSVRSTDARTPSATGNAGLEARIAQLEQALADLKHARPKVELEDSDADRLLLLLAENKQKFAPGNAEAKQARIEMLEKFLEKFPKDPRAADQLSALVAENLTGDAKESVAALERWRGKIQMDPWRFDAEYANALGFAGRTAEADRAYDRVIQNPDAPEHDRWNARFFAAYLQAEHGNVDEARRRYQALIAEADASSSPSAKSAADGARAQLAALAGQQPR